MAKYNWLNRRIVWSLFNYAGFSQLCGSTPIMRKIMCAHNRIILPSLVWTHKHLTDALFVRTLKFTIAELRVRNLTVPEVDTCALLVQVLTYYYRIC